MLTDGFDSGSTHTWRQAADEISRADVAVYAIQYASDFGARTPRDLYRLLEESGGAWFGEPKGDYTRILGRLENDLRRRYVLAIRPDTTRPGVHTLKVDTTHPEWRVRARKAYVR